MVTASITTYEEGDKTHKTGKKNGNIIQIPAVWKLLKIDDVYSNSTPSVMCD